MADEKTTSDGKKKVVAGTTPAKRPTAKAGAKPEAAKKPAKPSATEAAKKPAAARPEAKSLVTESAAPGEAAPQARPVRPKPAKPVAPKPKRVPEKAVKVTQIGSPIGREDYQRATLRGLGLNKMHRTRVLEDTPAVRGMIERVKHLVRIEPAS